MLPNLLISHDGLLVVRFLDFLSENHIRTVAFLQALVHLLHDIELFSFHFHDSVGQSRRLSLVVVHVLVNVVLALGSIFVQLCLVALNSLLFQLQLALLFAHLVSQLLQHGNLFASLIVHNRRLLAQL